MVEMRDELLDMPGSIAVEAPYFYAEGDCLIGISKSESREAFEAAVIFVQRTETSKARCVPDGDSFWRKRIPGQRIEPIRNIAASGVFRCSRRELVERRSHVDRGRQRFGWSGRHRNGIRLRPIVGITPGKGKEV